MCESGTLSCTGKLVRVVLDNRGPLSPSEIAVEGNITELEAREAVDELETNGFAKPVCGLRASQEEVYTLTETGATFEPTDE